MIYMTSSLTMSSELPSKIEKLASKLNKTKEEVVSTAIKLLEKEQKIIKKPFTSKVKKRETAVKSQDEEIKKQIKKFQNEVQKLNPSNNYSKLYDKLVNKFDLIFNHKHDGCGWKVCDKCNGEYCDFQYEYFHVPKVCSIYSKI